MGSHFPSMEGVVTPLGVAEDVWATSETHIGMSGTFTVNRVEYRVRLDLHFRDGAWQEGDKDDWSAKYHALMVDRVWDYPGGKPRPDTSASARGKIHAALVPWFADFAANEATEMLVTAGVNDRASKIFSKRAQIETLKSEIAAAERELQELESA